ncbi:TPA: hypothetical protein ACHT8X_003785 [Klebsiella pneumoniae]
MLGYSLLRLGLFVALAIVACTAVGSSLIWSSPLSQNKQAPCNKNVK